MRTCPPRPVRRGTSRAISGFVLGVLLSFAAAAPTARADVVYSYTGNDYDSFHCWYDCPVGYGQIGDPSPSTFLTASFTVADALPDDRSLAGESVAVLDWTISDQTFTLSPSGGNSGLSSNYLADLLVGTDASGDIIQWDFSAETTSESGLLLDTDYVGDGSTFFCCGTIAWDGGNADPGTWAETTTPDSSTPEPSTSVLVSLGGAILLFAMRRRHRRRLATLFNPHRYYRAENTLYARESESGMPLSTPV